MAATVPLPEAVGMDRIASLPGIAERVNFQLFQQAAPGRVVRIGGKLVQSPTEPQRLVLNTMDGGCLGFSPDSQLPHPGNGFVEVVGTKAGDAMLACSGVAHLPGEVDMELWDEAVKMTQQPMLRGLFAPEGSA
mmetsp:Transcript_84640/g.168094  ORF Transcript_84640/g.168094 Transcript_84640/m.168094 type:complete len:134 (+) Transcript_84640:64-465(+)